MLSLAAAFIRANWKPLAIGLAVVLITIAAALYIRHVREQGRDDIRKEDAAATAAAALKASKARETAAEERVNDAATTAGQHEERTDAIHATPDTRPSDRALRRRCIQLRQQGLDPARVPGGERCPPAGQAAPKR